MQKNYDMYRLTKKAIEALKNDRHLRRAVANSMGVGEEAIKASIAGQYEGRSIAVHKDGLDTLVDKTGLIIKDLREKCVS